MQRYVSVLAVIFLTVAVALPGRAGDPSTAQSIIEKATKAAGGEAKLTKYIAGSYKAKCMMYGRGAGDLNYTQETAFQFPDRCRIAITADILDETIVLNGNKGWIRVDGKTEELTGDELVNLQETLYTSWVASLAPLTDKAFTLVALGDRNVGGRAVEGVLITRKGRPDVKLYVDKKRCWS